LDSKELRTLCISRVQDALTREVYEMRKKILLVTTYLFSAAKRPTLQLSRRQGNYGFLFFLRLILAHSLLTTVLL
jgi:hypothetical protein